MNEICGFDLRGTAVHKTSRRSKWWFFVAAAGCVASLGAQPGFGQEGGLFPQPLEVEHRLVQIDGDGRFEGDPVKDTYVGSAIVSERPDGSRLVIDLERREMTEISPKDGTYWSIDFDRFADLRARLARLAGPTERPAAVLVPKGGKSAAPSAAKALPAFELLVEELAPGAGGLGLKSASSAGDPGTAVWRSAGLQHFAVKARQAAGEGAATAAPGEAVMEVWVDPQRRFSPAASAALARFESDAFAPGAAPAAVPFEKVLAVVRGASGNALAVRTVRPLEVAGRAVGTLETEVLAVREATDFDAAKLRVPEGLRRRPHPLEMALQQLEQEERINAALAGKSSDQP